MHCDVALFYYRLSLYTPFTHCVYLLLSLPTASFHPSLSTTEIAVHFVSRPSSCTPFLSCSQRYALSSSTSRFHSPLQSISVTRSRRDASTLSFQPSLTSLFSFSYHLHPPSSRRFLLGMKGCSMTFEKFQKFQKFFPFIVVGYYTFTVNRTNFDYNNFV